MILFFATFFLLLLAASIITNGFFLVTRGHWEDKPDGTREKKGALLKGWYFYWFKEKFEPNIYYYKGDELQAIFDRILALPFIASSRLILQLEGDYSDEYKDYTICDYFKTSDQIAEYLPRLRNALGVKFEVKAIASGTVIVKVYKEEPNYVHSWYLRTVMSGCITCFSSIYGALIFVLFNLTLSKSMIYFSFYSCFGYTPSYIYYPLTLVAFCLSLAWLNTVLWKKV